METEEETIQPKPIAEAITPLIQRQVEPEEEEEEEPIQAKQASGQTAHVGPGLQARINSMKGGGRPLPRSVRNFFEPRFGHDFSGVRVHTGSQAAEATRSVNARAFTLGKNVVFGAGQYSPGTTGTKKLLGHELAHVVQQKGLTGRLQSMPSDKADCPGYEPGEVRTSRTSTGHVSPDVTLHAPGYLLISDFGVNWRSVKRSTQNEPLLKSWLSTFESDDSYRLRIIGYSDCVGNDRLNTHLRHGRAERVERLLGLGAHSRVTFRGMKGLGEYVTNTDNNSVANRAKNRGVMIEFRQEFTFPAEDVKVTRRHCGPDITQWLINQMNTNRNHPVIKKMQTKWPRYVPFLNIGWTAAALRAFALLVRRGGPWDFKSNQKWWRASAGRKCPTTDCDLTVTMCGMCFNYDVPGNIHFGWIGRAGNLRSWVLHFAAGVVQPGRWTDDPKDAAAVAIGEAMWSSRAHLCDELRRRRNQLNLHRTENCSSCSRS